MSDISVPRLLHGKEAKLQCTISGYFPDHLLVNWLRREAGKPDLFPVSPSDKYKLPVMDVTRQEDQTFTCTASLIYTVSQKTDHGSEFICQVGHPSLERPLEKRTGELDVEGIPVVNVIHVDTVSNDCLVAEVKGYYPGKTKVTWSRRSRTRGYEPCPLSDADMEVKENEDGTVSLSSRFKATKPITSNELQYKVSVEHKSLECLIETDISAQKEGYFIIEKEGKRPVQKLKAEESPSLTKRS
uniref:Ig-like domain-containing protein n=1 Tax=Leptobrachium leishanense TaxID=445787 RepID=A0A8C5W7W1_9ANUR